MGGRTEKHKNKVILLMLCAQALEAPDSATVDEQAKRLHNLIGQLSSANQRVAGLLFHHLKR